MNTAGTGSFYSSCGIISVPWLVFSWGNQNDEPLNNARHNLFHRWGFRESHAMRLDKKKFHDLREGVENKIIFRTDAVSGSHALHSARYSDEVRGGRVCVPLATQQHLLEEHPHPHPHPQPQPQLSCTRLMRRDCNESEFEGVIQDTNRGHHGLFLNKHGVTCRLPKWCPLGRSWLAYESSIFTRIEEADVPHLQLAVFHYRVRSAQDLARKTHPSRHRAEKYAGHERAANRLDVFDPFMLQVRQRTHAQSSELYRHAARVVSHCPKQFFWPTSTLLPVAAPTAAATEGTSSNGTASAASRL